MKLILNWAASCGGCDVSILDIGSEILKALEGVDILYWPVAMDAKREDLEAIEDGSVDVGIINGAIRTSEQEEEAKIVRKKCKYVVAYGSCACFGGIPGLANLFPKEKVLKRAYVEAESNEEGETIPSPEIKLDDFTLTLPEFYESVKPLDAVIDVDLFVPGCPPSIGTIKELLDVLKLIAEGKQLERRILASDKALCYDCPRNATKSGKRIERLYRPHEVVANDEKCLLEQGILCLGFATRGGCGARCINANMPCRGCYGPVGVAGMSGITATAAIVGRWEDEIPPAKLIEALNIKDVAGIFYNFTLPVGRIRNEKR
ncbi:NADH-quinone oxidoreductase subunit B family protein [Archaeoglobus veneficus]|uniref:NADH ubiquinone oxidoreductase 20 kDa subunit n=1 Tax=Archaeoglobus veneficus (strain DSM 11195 / SNP6) TaxID=693661 RepID=F2KRB5_ARCVS|nr:NADH ubiquinone dehydrogenase [Archaeoglobus veneficus]AEA47849.1 NADH ubiquinone oxidoreductase 20 kDa subunit [Archaeoglobus veneficus SNP6]